MYSVRIQGFDRTKNSGALAASLIVNTEGARLGLVAIHNNNAAARFIQIFDSATVPADASVPLISYSVAATSGDVRFFEGRPFANGIVIVSSTTGPTKTISGADCLIDATFHTS